MCPKPLLQNEHSLEMGYRVRDLMISCCAIVGLIRGNLSREHTNIPGLEGFPMNKRVKCLRQGRQEWD